MRGLNGVMWAAIVIGSLVVAVPQAVAEVPLTLSYQGFLTDAVGNPVTGEWTLSFSFHHEKTGGEPFHQETVDVVTQLGLFSAALGEEEANPLSIEDFAAGAVWLELSIETDVGPVVLKPRQQVVSNPFAFHASAAALASDAGKLGGKDPAAYVTVEKAGEVCVTPDSLAAQVAALGFVPGPHYTDADVAKYLQESGFLACQCYGDDQVAAYLLASGYVPGPHFSGDYADLVGAPDLSQYVKATDLEGTLAALGVLLSDGSVPVTGNLNFMGKQAVNLVVHNAKNAPLNPVAGQLWWETGAKVLRVFDGTSWVAAGGGTAMDLSCGGCVDAADVSFPFAAGSDKGGAALSALDLACQGCIGADEVGFSWAKGVLPGGDAEHALTADTATNSLTANQAANVTCVGCVQVSEIDPAALAAKYVSFSDVKTKLGATTVQGAFEKIVEGGAGGGFQEGNGTVLPFEQNWGMPAYGAASTYLHLMNPTTPKVVTWLYGEESTGFSTSNNLVVAYDFAPNKYSASVNGTAGQSVLQVGNPSNFTVGASIMVHQTVGTGGNGTGAGTWELNKVLGVEGSTLLLAKALDNSYVSDGTALAQAVVAASYNQLEIVNGGIIRPAITNPAAQSGLIGGIVYVRARKIIVKTGGRIHADGMSAYQWGDDWSGYKGEIASSECKNMNGQYGPTANCSGGGGGNGSSNWNSTGGGGGGGNKTAGKNGSGNGGQGGAVKGDAAGKTLHFGGSGGSGYAGYAGGGGGIVVLGAETIIVESGGEVSARGTDGSCCCGNSTSYSGGGGGAGGTIFLFTSQLVNNGTITVAGGKGSNCGDANRVGGEGGSGWQLTLPPIPGTINESFAKGIEIYVDGKNVTGTLGDPNQKGAPHWDAVEKKWGSDGLHAWSTGPLDLTTVTDWTLGEHRLEFKETGGSGGDLKMFTYVIYPFTKSSAPVNDTCDTPVLLDLSKVVTLSASTEDVMGKVKATDANQAPFCGGSGGPDLVYAFTLTQWRQVSVNVLSAFTPRTYIKKGKCLDGDVVGCGGASWTSGVLEPGTYYFFVDGDGNLQKGDFTFTLTPSPPGPPENDTCAKPQVLIFENGTAKASGMTLFSTSNYKAACGGDGALDNVYQFEVPAGTSEIAVSLTADFSPALYISKDSCTAAPIACAPGTSYTMAWPTPGTYFLFVDGKTVADKGLYSVTVTLK